MPGCPAFTIKKEYAIDGKFRGYTAPGFLRCFK